MPWHHTLSTFQVPQSKLEQRVTQFRWGYLEVVRAPKHGKMLAAFNGHELLAQRFHRDNGILGEHMRCRKILLPSKANIGTKNARRTNTDVPHESSLVQGLEVAMQGSTKLFVSLDVSLRPW